MRFVQIGFGIFMLGGLATLGCGGSDAADPLPGTGGTGMAGKGGGAGTAGGLTGGTGGATGGTAGTGGATGGSSGTATGGTAGTTGGSAGKGGAAGTGGASGTAGMNSGGEGGGSGEMCPVTAPMDGAECDDDVNPGGGDACTYMSAGGETTCSCSGFMDPTWNCESLSCPMAAPTDGDMCDTDMNPSFGDDPCVYGMVECTCGGGGGGGGMATWNCAAPPMCPGTAPMDGDMCDTDTDPGAMDGGCVFGMTTCVCAGGGGGGGMQTWNCGTCPATEPEDEDECDNTMNAFCSYADTNCTCGMGDEWNCN
jgi:hypothetical protein